MAVAFGPEGVVFGPTRGVVLNRILRPVMWFLSIRAMVFSRTLAAFSGLGTASNRSRNLFAPTSS